MKLERCHNIHDLRRRAKQKLPAPLYHYLEGGADDEWSMNRNTAAFDDYALQPAYLRDIEHVDTRTTVLGCSMALPFFLSPTGMSRLFHHEKEPAVARAAAKFGLLYTLSTVGTTSLEEIAGIPDLMRMFQIYILKDRELTREFVQRCKAANYQAMCLTVDTPLAGNRERDRVHGMTLPPKFGLKSLLSFAMHPGWTWQTIRNPGFALANVEHRVDAVGEGTSVVEYINQQFDRTVTWDDAAWIIEEWGGPFVIKGLQTAADARRAVEVGASAVMISNHGGRQLDGTPAPIDCLADMRQEVGDALELIVDGGIRRGTHVLKALAMGADACSIGRPYLYGLAAGGQAGVERALTLLCEEIERDMALLGVTRTRDLTPECVSRLTRFRD